MVNASHTAPTYHARHHVHHHDHLRFNGRLPEDLGSLSVVLIHLCWMRIHEMSSRDFIGWMPFPSDSVETLTSTHSNQVAGWLSGSVLDSINEVTLRRARLVLGRMTVCRRVNHSVCNHPLRPTQPSTPSGTENEYRPKCGDALRLGSKGRYGSFHLWINVWVAGKTV